jgi:adenylosuccinate lyase
VQRNALRAWDEETDFRSLVEADEEIASLLGREEIAEAFDLDDAIRHIDVLFERLAALTHEKEEVVA